MEQNEKHFLYGLFVYGPGRLIDRLLCLTKWRRGGDGESCVSPLLSFLLPSNPPPAPSLLSSSSLSLLSSSLPISPLPLSSYLSSPSSLPLILPLSDSHPLSLSLLSLPLPPNLPSLPLQLLLSSSLLSLPLPSNPPSLLPLLPFLLQLLLLPSTFTAVSLSFQISLSPLQFLPSNLLPLSFSSQKPFKINP